MIGVISFTFLVNLFGSLVNCHPLFADGNRVEISGQKVLEIISHSSSTEDYVIPQEDGLLAEGPIPFSNHPPKAYKAEHNEETEENEHVSEYPSWFTSTLLARRLLALSTTGVFSTIFPKVEDSSLSGTPIGLPDYIASCDDKFPDYNEANGEGNPTILGLKIGTAFRNIEAGSNLSISIDWWGRDPNNKSPASLPRLTLLGYLEKLPTPPQPPSSYSELETCFLDAHPDARWWLPDRDGAVHDGFWARMVVQEGYWIGGFGDVARIGWLNVTEWKGVRKDGSVDGVGDGSGRGWGDVRLPGEEAV